MSAEPGVPSVLVGLQQVQHQCSTNYALVEVLVDNGFVKQRRLADATLNLAQRIGLQLTAAETATQLMVEDFTVCRQIEQTEYVDWLFQAKSKFGI